MNTLEEFRIFLKKKFDDNVISQNALAKILGVEQASLSKFAGGKTGIAGETVFKIIKYFNIQVTMSDNPCIDSSESITSNDHGHELKTDNERLMAELLAVNKKVIELQEEKIAALSKYGPAVLPKPVSMTEPLPGKETASFLSAIGADPQKFSEYSPSEKVDFLLHVICEKVAKCPEFSSTCLYFGMEQMLLENIPYNDGLQAMLDRISEVRRGAIMKRFQFTRRPDDPPNGHAA